MHDPRDEINKLTKGGPTFLKLGSRSISHRLTKDEQTKFEIALKNGYLVNGSNQRINLKNSFIDYKKAEELEPIILEDNIDFPSNYDLIIKRIEKINPIEYSKTRNFLRGEVTKLSPYITRGVITLKQIWDHIINKFPNIDIESQIFKELAWREYFLRVRENLDFNIFKSLNIDSNENYYQTLPSSIINYDTGINILDKEIEKLMQKGYIHNHSRMWIASIIANISKTNWKIGADWMYYHLLDGELSSNYLSWQWVAGSSRNKKYYVNQDNINLFSNTLQKNTFLDYTYEELPLLNIPVQFNERILLKFKNQVNQISSMEYDKQKKTLLYSAWNLDPKWYSNNNFFQRILLLEPSHFNLYPVSGKVLSFIIKLAKEIKGLKIVIKEYKNLDINSALLITKLNLNTKHWKAAQVDKSEYLFPETNKYYKSFFEYWKNCLKENILFKN